MRQYNKLRHNPTEWIVDKTSRNKYRLHWNFMCVEMEMRFTRRRLRELNHYMWSIWNWNIKCVHTNEKRRATEIYPFFDVQVHFIHIRLFFFKWPKKISGAYIYQLSTFLSRTRSCPHSLEWVCRFVRPPCKTTIVYA